MLPWHIGGGAFGVVIVFCTYHGLIYPSRGTKQPKKSSWMVIFPLLLFLLACCSALLLWPLLSVCCSPFLFFLSVLFSSLWSFVGVRFSPLSSLVGVLFLPLWSLVGVHRAKEQKKKTITTERKNKQ